MKSHGPRAEDDDGHEPRDLRENWNDHVYAARSTIAMRRPRKIAEGLP